MTYLKARLYSFLRAREEYMKTDLVYLFSGSFWLGAIQVAGMASSLLVGVAFAHFLSKESYGTYKYLLSIATLITAFSLSGLGTSIVQSVSEGDTGSLRRGFRTYLKSGILIFVISLFFAAYYFMQHNMTLAIGIIAAGICLPFIGAATLYDSYLQGKRAFKLSALLGFVNTFIPAVLLVGFVWFVREPLPIIIAYFVLNVFVDICLYRFTRARFDDTSNKSLEESDRYSAHLSAMNILTVFSTQVDQILLFHLFGAATLAIYAFAIAIPEQMKGFVKNIGTLALPRFAQSDPESVKSSLVGKTLRMSLVTAIPIVAYIAVAPYLFEILFPQYMSSVFYSQLFALSLISGSNTLPLVALQAVRDTRRLYNITITTGVLQIGLIVAGGYGYGLLGVICARILGRFASAVYTLVVAVW